MSLATVFPANDHSMKSAADPVVRVWDVTQPENSLKLAIRPLGGKINDLAWDGESKRIVVGGEGKDRYGAAFFMDSGSSCGEVTGHSKVTFLPGTCS
jgi:WD40 repeat protein